MNKIINSSGIYDITAYNLTANKATILSTLNISGTTTLNNVIMNGSLNSSNSLNSNTTINGTLNVSGTTILNNITTINSPLNVSGVTTLSNRVGIGITPTSCLELFNLFYATYKIKFGGIYAPNRIYSSFGMYFNIIIHIIFIKHNIYI